MISYFDIYHVVNYCFHLDFAVSVMKNTSAMLSLKEKGSEIHLKL